MAKRYPKETKEEVLKKIREVKTHRASCAPFSHHTE
jgi:hypothetical protein